ncbi:hypothetical protein BJP25_21230 [Actinokineospora bangkokensis]|uniref:SH3b domain-containing protein n=2 Tax=Actinokineospora bangkokensis TaxID=1193682 RepID=A0A1Q9LKR9_9PSEU|nr:hypothetical protein BJP25_21230 [Actinokineospora bangkokensis]
MAAGAALSAAAPATAASAESVRTQAIAASPLGDGGLIFAIPLRVAVEKVAAAAAALAARVAAGDNLDEQVRSPAPGHAIGAGVRVRSTPVGGTVRGLMPTGEAIDVRCVDATPHRDGHRWAAVRRTGTRSTGWVRTDLIAWVAAAPVCH